jgi:predicted outer membrane lipoprotein
LVFVAYPALSLALQRWAGISERLRRYQRRQELVNAFGVINAGQELVNAFGVINAGQELANAFGVINAGLELANAFGVIEERWDEENLATPFICGVLPHDIRAEAHDR